MDTDNSISSFFFRGRDPRRTFAFDRILYSDEYGVQVTPIGIRVGHGYRRNVIDIDRITRVEVLPGEQIHRRKWISKMYPTCFPPCRPQKYDHAVAVHLCDGKVHTLSTQNPDDLIHALDNARSSVY